MADRVTWKKAGAGGKHYSPEQRTKMVQMVKSGQSITRVAKIVGCHISTLWYLVQQDKKGELNHGRGDKSKTVSLDFTPRDSILRGNTDSTLQPTEHPASLATLCKRFMPETRSTDLASENDYLRWAVTGALAKVDGKSFIDRLIDDVRSGKLG